MADRPINGRCVVMVSADHQPRVLFIMGPTASGKTDLAVQLVQRFPFEIISVDSALVYRDMNIGTAKPDVDILRRAPHWLIDILDPAEAYSAARFRKDALAAIRHIHSRDRIPLLVGGTMLYYRVLQQGLANLPAADPGLRARLKREQSAQGLATLHARLANVDPAAAARIHPNDSQRIQRALEVYELAGQPMTELYGQQQDEVKAFKTCKLILAPADRRILHERIEQRFYRMIGAGFLGEVESLRARGDLTLDNPAMRAVGYRQVWEYLEGSICYTEMMQRGVIATRQFAKRQLTWLRAEPNALWLDPSVPKLLDRIIEQLYRVRFLP